MFPSKAKLLENLILLASITVGVLGISFLNPVYSLLYLAFVAAMHLFVLRKVVCTNCPHYDGSCHLGWNNLSSKLFEKGKEGRFEGNMKRVGAPAWIFTLLLPIVAMIISMLSSFTFTVASTLALYIVLVGGAVTALGAFGCSGCDMGDRCCIGRVCPFAG